jgi:hypothetical protein
MTPKQYESFLMAFLDELGYLLITTGDEIVLPSCLGSLQAMRYPYKKPLMDFGATNKKKAQDPNAKGVKYTNMSTNGYWVYVHWSKRPNPFAAHAGRFKHAGSFAFRLQRSLKRRRNDLPEHRQPRITLVEFFRDKGHYFYRDAGTLKDKYRVT